MDGNWYEGPRGCVGGGTNEKPVGEGDGPGEDLDDKGRASGFGGADNAEDVFDVVADDTDYQIVVRNIRATFGGVRLHD